MSELKVNKVTPRSGTTVTLGDSGDSVAIPTGVGFNGFNFRNKIINGDFSIAQRGTSFTSSANNDDAYTLDRWYILSDGNDAIDVTQETTTVPTNQLTAIALDVETADKKFGIAQIIEQKNCVGLIGNTVTLSFKAKVSATTDLDNIKCAIVAWDGTADTVTSDIISAWGAEGTNPTLIANATYENAPVNLNVTTSYATYSVTAAVDTASTKNIIVFIWSDVTTVATGNFLYITDVQLEAGTTASDFEFLPVDVNLGRCERYCEVYEGSSEGSQIPQSIAQCDLNNRAETIIHYTRKRASPTISVNTVGNLRVFTMANTNVTPTDFATSVGTGLYGANIFCSVASGVSTNSLSGIIYLTFNGSAKITIDSEL
jgi:hypothetical protein